jgi:hypothetical protein
VLGHSPALPLQLPRSAAATRRQYSTSAATLLYVLMHSAGNTPAACQGSTVLNKIRGCPICPRRSDKLYTTADPQTGPVRGERLRACEDAKIYANLEAGVGSTCFKRNRYTSRCTVQDELGASSPSCRSYLFRHLGVDYIGLRTVHAYVLYLAEGHVSAYEMKYLFSRKERVEMWVWIY